MGVNVNRQQEEVLREIVDNRVRFVRLWFTDVVGQLKAIAIDPGQLEDAFTEGIGFDGSSIEGMTRVYESDMLLVPDASTFQILPWRRDEAPAARLICSIYTPEGQPSRTDPRGVLQRVLDHAQELGFTAMVHPEIEFYLLKPPATADHVEPVDGASYFDYIAWGESNSFRRRIIRALEDVDVSVQFSHHEGGAGQNEIDLRAVDALRAADNIVTTRSLIEEIALRENMVATFMPKPFIDQPGSGMHLHMSLFEGDENAFYSPSSEYQLSSTARYFIGGLMAHARECAAVTNQHVNSYKRLWAGGEAPAHVCWGHNNRSALLRVPLYKLGKRSSSRVEYRAPDPAMNPYLGLAVLIAAGLDGIENRIDPGEETLDDAWSLSLQERRALEIQSLPASLDEALREMRDSEFLAATLGEEVFDYVLRNGWKDWEDYNRQITPKEYDRFLMIR